MEWITAISQLLGSVAWPVTVLILVFLFRRQIGDRLNQPFTKLKIPGTEIEFEVKKLEANVQTGSPKLLAAPKDDPAIFLAATDLQLSMARLRVAIENDLFRIAQLRSRGDASEPATINQRLDELVRNDAIPASLAENVRAFLAIANRVVHGADLSDDVKGRATIIGANIAAQVDYRRKVIELECDMDANLLWHMVHRRDTAERHYYLWSAIAASCPDFDCDYDVYRAAAERHNKRLAKSIGDEGAATHRIDVVSLHDFIQILEFREAELMRLVAAWKNGHESLAKANDWHWPAAWGDLGWGGPVVRSLSFNEVERQLMETRSSITRYRTRTEDNA